MNDSETITGPADDIPRSDWRSPLMLGAVLANLPRQLLVAMLSDSVTTQPSTEPAPNIPTTQTEIEK